MILNRAFLLLCKADIAYISMSDLFFEEEVITNGEVDLSRSMLG